MPRNGSGVYTLPAGNPVVDSTLIESTWANPTMSDIAIQLNNLITKDGILSPTAPIKFLNGSAATPGITFLGYTNSGFYRTATIIGVSFGGASKFEVSAVGADVKGDLDVTGELDVGTNLGVTGNLTLGGTLGLSAPLPVASGGTGGATASAARTNLGAAASGVNTDITSLAGPSLGAATATTPAGSDNSTKVATTALVRALGQAYLTGTGYSSNTTLTDYAYGQFFYLSGTMTLTLPVADASNIGRSITCHCYTTGQITVAPQSGQTLYYQGTTTTTGAVMMGAGDTLTFVNYNGSAWMAIGANSLGIGQTWQGVTRNAGTTYTNTTGKPITLSVHGTPDTSNAYIIATVGGTTVGGQATASSAYGALQVVVPPGLTYSWTMSAGSLSNITCRELR